MLTILDACRWSVASQVLDSPNAKPIPEDQNVSEEHSHTVIIHEPSQNSSILDHSMMENSTLMSGR